MTSKKNFNPIWIEVHITAADRNRTGTGITTHGILSPGRLPIPPLRRGGLQSLAFECSIRIPQSKPLVNPYF